MTITARYAGRCSKCGGPIRPGTQIEWDKATRQTSHADCRAEKSIRTTHEPLASIPGGARQSTGRNRKPGWCEDCGQRLAAGEGRLQYCMEDSGCMKHFDHSGYHLYCADSAACSERTAQVRAAAKARKEEAARAKEAAAPIIEQLSRVRKSEHHTHDLPANCRTIWSECRAAGSESWYASPDGTIFYGTSDYDMGPNYWRAPADITEALVMQAKTISGLRPNLAWK